MIQLRKCQFMRGVRATQVISISAQYDHDQKVTDKHFFLPYLLSAKAGATMYAF